MATRSTRLWGPVTVGTTPLTLLGPLVDTALIKNLRLVRPVATGSPVLVRYGVDGVADGQLVGAVMLDNGPMVWADGTWLVLEPGETLVASTSDGTIVTSGYGTVLTGGGSFP